MVVGSQVLAHDPPEVVEMIVVPSSATAASFVPSLEDATETHCEPAVLVQFTQVTPESVLVNRLPPVKTTLEPLKAITQAAATSLVPSALDATAAQVALEAAALAFCFVNVTPELLLVKMPDPTKTAGSPPPNPQDDYQHKFHD